MEGYEPFDPIFGYLFNSYYEAMGARHPRPARGLLTRPSAARVMAYRAHVDLAMERLLSLPAPKGVRDLTVLGLAHEEQHQELILMDILSLFAVSPLVPAYAPDAARPEPAARPPSFAEVRGGRVEIGRDEGPFAFDNESPRHETLLSALSPGQPTGHQRRMAGVHGGRRLSAPRVLAGGRLGEGLYGGMGGAALLGTRWPSVADNDASRAAPGGSRGPRGPRQLL